MAQAVEREGRGGPVRRGGERRGEVDITVHNLYNRFYFLLRDILHRQLWLLGLI
jgi:hypothetical protein